MIVNEMIIIVESHTALLNLFIFIKLNPYLVTCHYCLHFSKHNLVNCYPLKAIIKLKNIN